MQGSKHLFSWKLECFASDKLAVDSLRPSGLLRPCLFVVGVLSSQKERKSVWQIISNQRFVNSCLANSPIV